MKRSTRLLLSFSLVLNLFLIGWMTGDWIKQYTPHAPLFQQIAQTMPEQARPILRQKMRGQWRDLLRSARSLRHNRQIIAELMAQPQLDETAMQTAMQQVNQDILNILSILQTASLQTMQELPPEVRQQWAQRWQKNPIVPSQTLQQFVQPQQ